MPERVVLIGTDEPGLDGLQAYLAVNPKAEVTILYPELNPLPEFVCSDIKKHLQCGMACSEELRAHSIDRENRHVVARDVVTGEDVMVPYDKLVLACGAAPGDLGVAGEHMASITRVGSAEDAKRLRARDGRTVVVGSGMNMLMAVSALMRHGTGPIDVVTVEGKHDTPLSSNMLSMVLRHLEQTGITVHRDQRLTRLTRTDDGYCLQSDEISVDAVRIVNATQSVPIVDVTENAGLDTTGSGAVIVDSRLRTSDENIYACGGCASFITSNCHIPVPGTCIRATGRRQAETLGASLCGRSGDFQAPTNTYSIQLDHLAVAGSGLPLETAKKCGFTPMSAMAIQFDRAHFMPGVEMMTLELVFDGPTRRVLGIQGLGKSADALCGRISAVSAVLPMKPTIDDISNLEMAYAPPFSSAMDVLNTVANVADNMLAGINESISPEEFRQLWAEREAGDSFFLDCRELGNAKAVLDRHPAHWNHIPQGEIARRIAEVPTDRKLVLICNTGTRSYEAQVILKHAGFCDVVNVEGGNTALRQSGIEV